jgi:hypothetical protein
MRPSRMGRFVGPRGLVIAALLAVGSGGCTPAQTADQAADAALQSTGRSKSAVFPLAGTVTIDGQPPEAKPNQRIVVMLNDLARPNVPLKQRLFVWCDPQGRFVFHTYGADDGLPAGKFVVTIASLSFHKKRGYAGPDALKNLYNDPDVNANSAEFVIEHQSPGKSDYRFDLKIENRPAAHPGPHALTKIAGEV